MARLARLLFTGKADARRYGANRWPSDTCDCAVGSGVSDVGGVESGTGCGARAFIFPEGDGRAAVRVGRVWVGRVWMGWISGLRESNPSSWLGKPEHYHYAKPANGTF
jgi:hypothetical protein